MTPIRLTHRQLITVDSIKQHRPDLLCVMSNNKKGEPIQFKAVEVKGEGQSLGSIYKKAHQLESPRKWMGKVGSPRGILRNDPSSVRTRLKKDINIDTIREKLAFDLFGELGQGIFLVPKSRLSFQPVLDDTTNLRLEAIDWHRRGIKESLRIMTKFVEGYQDIKYAGAFLSSPERFADCFAVEGDDAPAWLLTPEGAHVPLTGTQKLEACRYRDEVYSKFGFIWVEDNDSIVGATILDKKSPLAGVMELSEAKTAVLPFMMFLKRYRRPPERIVIKKDRKPLEVPLIGMVELLAVGRCLADVDLLGGGGKNAGFVCIKEQGETVAKAVKIDPGYAFCFTTTNQKDSCENVVINTEKKLGFTRYHLEDLKDIQTSPSNPDVFIHWRCLTDFQQKSFLETLLHIERYVKSDRVLDFLFFRDGQFCISDQAEMSRQVAEDLIFEMKTWVKHQLNDIYQKPLQDFRRDNPLRALRFLYIDHFGGLYLPFTDKIVPITKLFTNLQVVERTEIVVEAEREKKKKRKKGIEVQEIQDAYKREGILDIWKNATKPTEESHRDLEVQFSAVSLNQLFVGDSIRKVLLIGSAGIGKSTLCQRIIFDWACGTSHNQFSVIYWLSLKDVSDYIEENDCESISSGLIARAITKKLYQCEEIDSTIIDRLEQATTLLLLDGYDEANDKARALIRKYVSEAKPHILISSRPDAIQDLKCDRIVYNQGFSREQVAKYCNNFFSSQSGELYPSRLFLGTIQNRSELLNLVHIPIILQMLCSLWERGEASFGNSMTEIYRSMVHSLLTTKWLQAGRNQEKESEFIEIISSIAYDMLIGDSLVISTRQMHVYLQNKEFNVLDIEMSGLFKIRGMPGTRRYEFLHLSFLEYLAGNYLCSSPTAEQSDFISKSGANPRHQLTCKFLLGCMHNATPEKIPDFFDTLTKAFAPNKNQMLIHVMECLNECNDIEQERPAVCRFFELNKNARVVLDRPFSLVHAAAYKGLSQVLKWLAKHQKSILDESAYTDETPMHAAAFGGQVEAMRILTAIQYSLASKARKDGLTPMLAAARAGQVGAMQWLYKLNQDLLFTRLIDGRTALHLAAQGGHLDVVQWIYSKVPKLLKCRTYIGLFGDAYTPMHIAARYGHIPVIEWFANVDSSSIFASTHGEFTPMRAAEKSKNVLAIEWFLGKGCKLGQEQLSCLDFFKRSWVFKATQRDLVDIQSHCDPFEESSYTSSLLGVWAEPDQFFSINADNCSAICQAALLGNLEQMEILIGQNNTLLDVVEENGWRPIHFAVQGGSLEAVEWILTRDCSALEHDTSDGITPLHLAAYHGHKNVIGLLLRTPSKTKPIGYIEALSLAKTHYGFSNMSSKKTGLSQLASYHTRKIIFDWILSSSSPLNKKAFGYITALHLAALKGHLAIVKILKFTQINNSEQFTPLNVAALNGHSDVMELLYNENIQSITGYLPENLQHPCLLATAGLGYLVPQDSSSILRIIPNWTAMHFAALCGEHEAIKWLFQKRPALLSHATADGLTPMHIAASRGYEDIVDWIHDIDKAQVDQADTRGVLPIHMAAQGGFIGTVACLFFANRSCISRLTRNGWTPLHYAAHGGHMNVIKWLHGKDPKLAQKKTNTGQTILDLAREHRRVDVEEWILEVLSSEGRVCVVS